MQTNIEPPKNDEEIPGIVGAEGLNSMRSTMAPKAQPIKLAPIAQTFHDHFASRLIWICLCVLVLVWFVDFLSPNDSPLTTPIFDILKMIITTCLGYLFAAQKYNERKDK